MYCCHLSTISPGVQYNRRNKSEKRMGSYRKRMLAKHILSVGNGRGLQEVFLINSFSLSRSMNSKEATRSNYKLVGPSDCQGRDDGVEPELSPLTVSILLGNAND